MPRDGEEAAQTVCHILKKLKAVCVCHILKKLKANKNDGGAGGERTVAPPLPFPVAKELSPPLLAVRGKLVEMLFATVSPTLANTKSGDAAKRHRQNVIVHRKILERLLSGLEEWSDEFRIRPSRSATLVIYRQEFRRIICRYPIPNANS